MDKRFALVFKSPNWSLRLKALVFGLCLWGAWAFHFSAVSAIVFIVVAIYFYFFPQQQNARLFFSFLSFFVLTWIAAVRIQGGLLFGAAAVSAAIFFYSLMLVKEYHVVDRQRWYRSLHMILIFVLSIPVFYASFFTNGWVGAILFLLLYEAIKYGVSDYEEKVRYGAVIFGAVGAFLLYQIGWALSWLPIGFIGQAGIFTLLYYVVREAMCLSLEGMLTRKALLRLWTVSLVLSATILIGSRWTSVIL